MHFAVRNFSKTQKDPRPPPQILCCSNEKCCTVIQQKNSIQKSKVMKSPLFQLASVMYLTITNTRSGLSNSLNDIVVLLDTASFKLNP